jgi:glucose/arabinose dehydrogenase
MHARKATIRSLGSSMLVLCAAMVLSSATDANAKIVGHRVAGNLRKAVAFTFDTRGRLWVVEKNAGVIRVVDPDKGGSGRRFFRVPKVVGNTEQGLVGIALHPKFPKAPYVYAFATRSVRGHLRDQILRIKSVAGSGRHMRVILSVPASPTHMHSGGRILFGPDRMLYAFLGDANSPASSQSLHSLRGKVLRMTPFGSVPKDNPIRGSRIFARGFRNSFGLGFDPGSRRLWETENGPECNDELNRVIPGRNFGWGPRATCSGSAPRNTNQDGPRPVLPQRWFTPTIAPTGIAFCHGCGLGPMSEDTFLFGDFNNGTLWRARLSFDRHRITHLEKLGHPAAALLSMEIDPKGHLYYSTYTGVFRLVNRT